MLYPAMLKLLLAACCALAATLASAAPVLEASRFNSGALVDGDAIGNRTPLVLVHGLGGSGEGWENFLQSYAGNPSWRAAFKPYTFRYASGGAEVLADPAAPRTIQALGGALRDALQAQYGKPAAPPHFGFAGRSIVVMAHSMGGLVARSMMQEHTFADGRRGGERVLHLVTLGTPHHGSPMADVAFALGLQYSEEFRDAYLGFIAGLAWTNFDGQNMTSGVCNPWLAALNNYAPSTYAAFGVCGVVPPNPQRGFYERIVAYGARTLQQPDLAIGYGSFKPGSSPALLASYTYMRNSLAGKYDNDGIVPFASAQFAERTIGSRHEAYACDHRFIERGYPVVVKSSQGSANEWAFCSASVDAGVGLAKSIHGAAGGIVDRIRQASEAERVLNWAETAFSGFLQPAGALTDLADGYYFRRYAGTGAHVGVKNGDVFYIGPASGNQVLRVASVAELLARAQAAGY